MESMFVYINNLWASKDRSAFIDAIKIGDYKLLNSQILNWKAEGIRPHEIYYMLEFIAVFEIDLTNETIEDTYYDVLGGLSGWGPAISHGLTNDEYEENINILIEKFNIYFDCKDMDSCIMILDFWNSLGVLDSVIDSYFRNNETLLFHGTKYHYDKKTSHAATLIRLFVAKLVHYNNQIQNRQRTSHL